MKHSDINYNIALIVLLIVIGCDESRKPRHDVVVPPNVVDNGTATAIHFEAASKRAEIYDNLAAKCDSGELKTVNDVVEYSTPLFNAAAGVYLDKITALRKSRLHDADDQLPADAAATFRLFAKEYRDAAK